MLDGVTHEEVSTCGKQQFTTPSEWQVRTTTNLAEKKKCHPLDCPFAMKACWEWIGISHAEERTTQKQQVQPGPEKLKSHDILTYNFIVLLLQLRTTVEVFVLSYDRYDIVVTGGYNHADGLHVNNTEIYNSATKGWREGPTLPQPICCMASVQYEDTFILVGGFSPDQFLDTIYQYDQTSETWILREERLSRNKGFMGAVLAGPPVAECNWYNKCKRRVNDDITGEH